MYHFNEVNSSVKCNYYVRVTREEKGICCEEYICLKKNNKINGFKCKSSYEDVIYLGNPVAIRSSWKHW